MTSREEAQATPTGTTSAMSGPEPVRPLRQPALPLLHLSFKQRYGSLRVQQAVRAIERMCRKHGAVIDRLFERKWNGAWLTGVSVRSERAFPFEEEARAWWQDLMQQFQRELPHQHLLDKSLQEARFSFTTPQLLGLAGTLSTYMNQRAG